MFTYFVLTWSKILDCWTWLKIRLWYIWTIIFSYMSFSLEKEIYASFKIMNDSLKQELLIVKRNFWISFTGVSLIFEGTCIANRMANVNRFKEKRLVCAIYETKKLFFRKEKNNFYKTFFKRYRENFWYRIMCMRMCWGCNLRRSIL